MNKIIRAIRRRGILNSAKAFYDRYWFELRYGLNMQSSTNQIQGDHSDTHYKYEPVSHFAFDRMLKKVDWKYRESTFLDYGCGKGAAILLASKFRFRKYVGIEYSKELSAACIGNIDRFSKKINREIHYEIICSDATHYEVPSDVNVFYFFNPFNYELLDKVLQNIELSLQKNNRDVLLLYFNARFKEVIEKYGYTNVYSEQVDKSNIWYQFGNYAYTKMC
jgi:SAM-dependent methyltransferase